jgi:hypothetical protein
MAKTYVIAWEVKRQGGARRRGLQVLQVVGVRGVSTNIDTKRQSHKNKSKGKVQKAKVKGPMRQYPRHENKKSQVCAGGLRLN